MPSNETHGSRLRVGVALNSLIVPCWIGRLLDAIDRSPWASVTHAHVEARPLSDRKQGTIAGLYRRLDRRWFGASAPLLESVDLTARLSSTRREGLPDLWLCLGAPRLAAIGQPRLGVWTLRVGGLSTDRMREWAVMDVLLRRMSLAVELRTQRGDDPARLLGRTLAQTDARSPLRAQQSVVPSVQALVLKALQSTFEKGGLPVDETTVPAPVFEEAPECLRDREMALLLLDHGLRFARERFDLSAYRMQWALAWHVDAAFPSSRPYQLVIPPADRFWADPFVGFDRGQRYVFFEELVYDRPAGVIAVVPIDEHGGHSSPEVALERPYHLSFPYVFTYRGDHFMIPETSANGQIEVYRASRFPHGWELAEIIMPSTHAADVTLLEHGGKYWMFADIAKDGTKIHSEALHLFHADSPFGPFTPHRANPVVLSAGRARPGGAVFRFNDQLLRPAQECSNSYGRATILHEITSLTQDRYDERVVQVIEPDWDPRVIQTHTFNRQGDVTVVDCKLRIPR